MKIKEVLEKTGLTDRAVRLYIEYGLISPETKSSYSGRKNIEFSDEDVEKLRQISLLRKADFSLPQISRISTGGEDASNALSEFLTDKRERHAADGEIINSLNNFEGEVTLETVAAALERSGAQKLEIKDLYLTYAEENEKQTFLAFGIFIILITSLAIVVPPILYFCNAIHPRIHFGMLLGHIILYIPVIAALIIGITLVTRYRRGTTNILSKKKRTISVVSIILAILLSIMGFFSVVISTMIPWVYTETTDIDDYLVLDNNTLIENRNIISKLFPSCVPNAPDNCTKYLYYKEYGAFICYHIYAEWKLDEEDYATEKARIYAMFPDAKQEAKGDFVCVYVKDFDTLKTKTACFAYNDKTHTVRYILDYLYDMDYSNLNWEIES